MKPADVFYAVATGSRRRRAILTYVGLVLFSALLSLPVFLGLLTDWALGLPKLPGLVGWIIGAPLAAAGGILWLWCVLLFIRARGTPVPFNPPRELVAAGPYACVRNPMIIGVSACMWAVGLFLGSASMVCVWMPLFFAANALELKLVEEPELERRIGASYIEYKRRVPMFVPRLHRFIGGRTSSK